MERLDRRANISDTDKGRELLLQINDLRDLLDAYLSQASLRSDNRHYNFPCEAFYLQGNIAQKTPFCPCHKEANVRRSTDTTNGLHSCFSYRLWRYRKRNGKA